MGEVLHVRHLILGTEYAVKILPKGLLSSVKARDMFRREACVLARLAHRNLIKVDDFGDTHGHPWFRMELATGCLLPDGSRAVSADDLLTWFEGRLPHRLVGAILANVLDGLACAHRNGVVHRDIKPANILLSSSLNAGREIVIAKIADFGILRVLQQSESNRHGRVSSRLSRMDDFVTTSSGICGTQGFMSPEQMMGESVDERSDFYSLGATVFYLLTGSLDLEQGLGAAELGMRQAAWERLLVQMLQFAPDDRVQSIDALKDLLDECADSGHGHSFTIVTEETCGSPDGLDWFTPYQMDFAGLTDHELQSIEFLLEDLLYRMYQAAREGRIETAYPALLEANRSRIDAFRRSRLQG
ncbi:MAG: serine/threonine protein kinase [Phycisphaerales bacterium]|nr:serine/threonine protein kinase [Phycisphaerales bacterium]